MFLIRYFKKSFIFSKLLIDRTENLFKIFIYFILLIIIANFPANFEAVKQQGSRLDFIEQSFIEEAPINWVLPNTVEIKGGKLVSSDSITYTNTHKGITYVINSDLAVDVMKNDYINHVFLNEDNIVYIDADKNFMQAFGYKGFSSDIFSFRQLNVATGQQKSDLFIEFGRSIEKSFGSFIVLYTIIRNTFVNIAVSLLFVFVLSLIIQLFKFGYANFLTYLEGLRFIVLSMGLASVFSFAVGLLVPAFSPVVFQLTIGMTVMLVLLVYSRRSFI